MKVGSLLPTPTKREAFRRNREKLISERSGCYVLTTFAEEILYIGLATNIRRRFVQHLDSSEKNTVTELGRAILFFWLESEDIQKIERTWLNAHMLEEGKLPFFNKVSSPVAT